MDRCLLDTSALSDVIDLRSKRPAIVVRHAKRYLRSHGHFTFSDISTYEILRGLRKKEAVAQEQRFREFCRHSELLPVTVEVLDRAATLWALGQKRGLVIGDADLIIAATAVVENLTLATANPKHFDWIDGLKTVNWRQP